MYFLNDPAGVQCAYVYVFTEATTTSELRINRLNIVKGPCTGKTEIYMLCDKVQKGEMQPDSQVVIYNGEVNSC